MHNGHYKPKLHKKRVMTHQEFTVYSVNGLAVRNAAQPDEEFGNFAMQDEFPHLIPPNEIWISEKTAPAEGIFFIANALTQMKAQADGVPDETAYEAGLNVERELRQRLVGVKFRGGRPHKRVPPRLYRKPYLTIPDEKFPIQAWVVDGCLARSFYKTDYTEGGHGYVYRWVPKGEIWIDDGVDAREMPFILAHEYLELRLMRDAGLEYDPAHEICSKVEFKLRKNDRVKLFLAPGRRKIAKGDLRRLTSPEFFEYVLRQYVRG